MAPGALSSLPLLHTAWHTDHGTAVLAEPAGSARVVVLALQRRVFGQDEVTTCCLRVGTRNQQQHRHVSARCASCLLPPPVLQQPTRRGHVGAWCVDAVAWHASTHHVMTLRWQEFMKLEQRLRSRSSANQGEARSDGGHDARRGYILPTWGPMQEKNVSLCVSA